MRFRFYKIIGAGTYLAVRIKRDGQLKFVEGNLNRAYAIMPSRLQTDNVEYRPGSVDLDWLHEYTTPLPRRVAFAASPAFARAVTHAGLQFRVDAKDNVYAITDMVMGKPYVFQSTVRMDNVKVLVPHPIEGGVTTAVYPLGLVNQHRVVSTNSARKYAPKFVDEISTRFAAFTA